MSKKYSATKLNKIQSRVFPKSKYSAKAGRVAKQMFNKKIKLHKHILLN
jgi:hypothetical protein